jgi:small subunit ribosomal protein S6
MRIYEELFIVRPDTLDEELDPLIDQFKGVITQAGGTIDKTEKWGIRKLAYRVLKQSEGQYVLMQFTAGPETVKELERRMRVADAVIKFITVRIDEKLKRIEKRKKAREKRAARKPVVPAAPPVIASPLLPQESPVPIPGAPGAGTPAAATPSAATPAVGTPAPAERT